MLPPGRPLTASAASWSPALPLAPYPLPLYYHGGVGGSAPLPQQLPARGPSPYTSSPPLPGYATGRHELLLRTPLPVAKNAMMLLCWAGSMEVNELPARYATVFGEYLPPGVTLPDLVADLTCGSERAVLTGSTLYAPERVLRPDVDVAQRWVSYIPAASGGYVIGKDGEGVKAVLAACGVQLVVEPVNMLDSCTLQRVVMKSVLPRYVPEVYGSVEEAWRHALAVVRDRLHSLHRSYCGTAARKLAAAAGPVYAPPTPATHLGGSGSGSGGSGVGGVGVAGGGALSGGLSSGSPPGGGHSAMTTPMMPSTASGDVVAVSASSSPVGAVGSTVPSGSGGIVSPFSLGMSFVPLVTNAEVRSIWGAPPTAAALSASSTWTVAPVDAVARKTAVCSRSTGATGLVHFDSAA